MAEISNLTNSGMAVDYCRGGAFNASGRSAMASGFVHNELHKSAHWAHWAAKCHGANATPTAKLGRLKLALTHHKSQRYYVIVAV